MGAGKKICHPSIIPKTFTDNVHYNGVVIPELQIRKGDRLTGILLKIFEQQVSLGNPVSYEVQNKTEKEKKTARENIGLGIDITIKEITRQYIKYRDE